MKIICLKVGIFALVAVAGVRGDVREELHRLLLADAAKAAKGQAASGAERVGTTRSTGQRSTPVIAPQVEAPRENALDRFFRTGILLGDRPADPVKKISVGPCEGGQLLNLKSAW